MALLASIVVSAISPDLLSAPVDGQDLSMMTLLTVVSLGGLITFVLVFCWIGILGQCVVNRYLSMYQVDFLPLRSVKSPCNTAVSAILVANSFLFMRQL